jgi:citrate lyase subunit beta/citryl-CoA lyase
MPVNTPRFVNRAWTRGCDYINLDLEDSVPEWQKPHARTLIREAIATVSKGGAEAFTRINHDYIQADLEAIVWPGLKRVNYPKAETAEEIRKLDTIITRLERERGIPPGTVEIGANIETATGVANGHEIASASPRIVDFGGGTGYDMSRDLGVEMFVGFDQFVYSKGELELAARVLGLEPTNPPFVPNLTGSVSDPDRAFQEADAARRCGLRHGSGLHPNVVEPQIRGLTPPPDEVRDAQQVLERYRRLSSQDKAWEDVEGRVVDIYEARRARELLQWAEACAERDREKAEAVARTRAAEGGRESS